jgi:hypothetical protein
MKATKANIQAVANEVNNTKTRSAWNKGVKVYALELLERFEEWSKYNEENGYELPTIDERTALNGARDWDAWAYGGCGLVYDAYIAERLCTPSELRKLDGGAKVPAGAATWCDIEARAARQAWRMIAEALRVVEYKQVKAEAVEGLQKLHGISEAEAVEQFGYIVEA